MDIASLGIRVDSSQAKEAFGALDNLTAAGGRAEKVVDKLGKTADANAKSLKQQKKEADDASRSIDKYIKSLQVTATTNGMTARETKLYELALKGASAAQLQAADSAIRMNEAYQKGVQTGDRIKTGLLAVGAAAATGFIAAAVAVEHFIKKAGEFQDIAEKTGDSAENIASLAVSAGAAGVSMGQISDFSVKLSKNLTGVDDESKAAGAAITALGLDLENFKKLKPADQIEALGKALNSFQDSGAKASALEALAKGSANLLPFLKDLGEEGSRQVILTQEQIRLADDYSDKQAKSRAQLSLYAQALSTQALPALAAFQNGLSDVAKELLGVDQNSSSLKGNTAIKEFADISALAIARLVDGLYDAGKALYALTGSFNVVAADLTALGKIAQFATPSGLVSGAITGNLDLKKALAERESTLKDANKRYEALANGLGLADKVRGQIAGRQFVDPRRLGDPGSIAQQVKGTLDYNGKDPKGKTDKSADQIAKAQLAFDIEQIKKGGEGLISAYSNSEKILEARRAAALVDEKDYYAAKLGFLNLNTQAQKDSLSKELARLEAEKLSGKDRIENDKKILDVKAKLAKLDADSTASGEVLKTQQTASAQRLIQYYRDAEDAAQSYLDTIIKAQQRELAGFGAGAQERDRTSGRAQIEDKYTEQRRALEKSRRDAEFAGTFGSEAKSKYDNELDLIRSFQAKALAEYDEGFKKRLALQQDWQIGASEALRNYYTDTQNIAKQTEELFTNAFKGMEDALVNFVTTGKADFKGLVDSIIADLVRIQIRKSITGPLSDALGGLFKSGGGTSTGDSSTDSAIGFGGSGGNLISDFFGKILGRANGGPVSAGRLYEVGEGGKAELLNVAGKQYLIPGNDGNVQPGTSGSGASSSGGSGGNTYIFQGQNNKNEMLAAAVQASRVFAAQDRYEANKRGRTS